MNYNSLDATARVWGELLLLVVLGGLVATGAWGALGFIVVMTPFVAMAERAVHG